MLSGTGFAEKGVEGVISSDSHVPGHLAMRLNAISRKAVKFQDGFSDRDTSLTNVY